MKKTIITLAILLAVSLGQAERIEHNRIKEAINGISSTVITICALQQITEGAIGGIAKLFLPQKAHVNIYYRVPFSGGRKIKITKQVLALKNAACPALVNISNYFR